MDPVGAPSRSAIPATVARPGPPSATSCAVASRICSVLNFAGRPILESTFLNARPGARTHQNPVWTGLTHCSLTWTLERGIYYGRVRLPTAWPLVSVRPTRVRAPTRKGEDMTNGRVTISINGGVADVRMNRPEKVNAIDDAQFAAIVDAGESLKKDAAVRAVVLSGNGRGFCAGLDFANFQQMAGDGRAKGMPEEG